MDSEKGDFTNKENGRNIMIIDTHCHFDMMSNPEQYIRNAEIRGDIILGMTNLPSHYKMGRCHLNGYRHIRLALGFHPQLAAESVNELGLFDQLVDTTSYIGEIGLDFSKNNYHTQDKQIACLRHILATIKGKNKIISVHSRRAEKVLLELLNEYEAKNVIFHWYSGSVNLVKDIIAQGYYFSVNEAMTLTPNGQKIIAAIPKNRILTESDSPFNNKHDINSVLKYLNESEENIEVNFRRLIAGIM